MSRNDDKPHAAVDRIKAATLSVAKGLSRAQAERAAAAAARNVNAYGQKEGPSRWQERKEAKRLMYLMSTEKAAKLGTVKPKASETSSVGAYTQCQKCFQFGHWTYECKNEQVYISWPSRTQQIKHFVQTCSQSLKMIEKLFAQYELQRKKEKATLSELEETFWEKIANAEDEAGVYVGDSQIYPLPSCAFGPHFKAQQRSPCLFMLYNKEAQQRSPCLGQLV